MFFSNTKTYTEVQQENVIWDFLDQYGADHGISSAKMCDRKILVYVWHYEYADALPVEFKGYFVEGIVE